MGRINLAALRVRKRALANLESKRTLNRPIWVDIMADIPPAQILSRQQPIQHPDPQIQTKALPGGRTKLVRQTQRSVKTKLAHPGHLYSPTALRYDEDAIRKQFFSDHPWELARPRVVLETSGNQYVHVDWSTGLVQPGIPLSGECVVQRQLWLIQNIPDITLAQSYDIARKEFYDLRRREATGRRIAVEEAQMMGAVFGPSEMARAVSIESKMYTDWEKWAQAMNMENEAKNANFSGQQLSAEKMALQETRQVDGGPPSAAPQGGQALKQPYLPGRPASTNSSRIGTAIGADVFERQERKMAAWGR